jgi:hypothetical protein
MSMRLWEATRAAAIKWGEIVHYKRCGHLEFNQNPFDTVLSQPYPHDWMLNRLLLCRFIDPDTKNLFYFRELQVMISAQL